MIRRCHLIVLAVGALAAAVVAMLSRHGPQRFLDTGSYVAVIESLIDGRGASSTLAPSFSHFSAAEFIARGGRVPFVDFPLGYPLLATCIAWLVGARQSIMIVAVLSSAVLAAVVVARPLALLRNASGTDRRDRWYWPIATAFALGLVVQPSVLLMTRAGLSEPLFCALTVSAAALSLQPDVADRDRSHLALLLVGASSLVRFVGLAAVIVPAALILRRRGLRRAWPWLVVTAALPLSNIVWSSAVGGGHRLALREITSFDVRVTVHSITGWLVNRYGTYMSIFRDEWVPWWGVVLAVVWMIAAAVALVVVITDRPYLPRTLAVPFAMAGCLTLGLYGGMLLFDSLVAPDVRLMAPAGVLTMVGLFWWLVERGDVRTVAASVAVWLVVAVAPWRISDAPNMAAVPELRDVTAGARIVVTDSADGVWWETGVPSVYLPLATRLLTGEVVDRDAELAALPCLLFAADGVIVLIGGPFADGSLRAPIEQLVADGVLQRQEFAARSGTIERFVPTGAGCVSESTAP